METISALEQMDEYIRKSKEKGEELFEFEYNDRCGVVVVNIHVPECDENGYRIIKIPSFVNFITSYAWDNLINPDKFVYYIPKGCRLDFPAMYGVNGEFMDEPCYLAKKSYKLEVEEGHENYVSENGVLFNRDKTVLLVYPSFKTEEEYIVPDSVVQILEGAFAENRYLKKLFISKNVAEIQPCQFVHSTSIEVDSENTAYKSDMGCLYSKDEKTCYHVFVEEFLTEEFDEIDEFIFSEEPAECIATEKVDDTDIANSKNIKEMKKYLYKAKMLGLDLFEFQYEEENDYVWISKIKEPMGHTQGHPMVKIPPFVSFMDNRAFLENDAIKENIKDAILYVSKECEIGYELCRESGIPQNFGEWLYKIVVEEGNEYYSSEEGVLFDKDKTEILAYPAYKTEEEYVIPDSVEKISGSSFPRNNYLKKIIISKNVIEINNCYNWVKLFIEVDSQNTRYKSIQGSLYSKDGKIAYFLFDHGNGRFRIEEGTIILKDFYLSNYVEELYLPSTLEPIDGVETILIESYISHIKIKAPKRLEKYLVIDEDRIEVEYYD